MVETRKIVIPGEVVGSLKEGQPGYGTYIDDENIVSKFLGIPKKTNDYFSVIPLSGVYVPKRGDKVIGIVSSVERVGWVVDVNAPWVAFMPLSEGVDEFIDLRRTNLKKFFDVGDVIYGEIYDVRGGDVHISMKNPFCRKLKGGVIVKITPSKVPRLIGTGGSMVNLIKEKTKTIIRVGQNGVVWISGEYVDKAIKAIKLVDQKSHIIGLTDEITKLLSE